MININALIVGRREKNQSYRQLLREAEREGSVAPLYFSSTCEYLPLTVTPHP